MVRIFAYLRRYDHLWLYVMLTLTKVRELQAHTHKLHTHTPDTQTNTGFHDSIQHTKFTHTGWLSLPSQSQFISCFLTESHSKSTESWTQLDNFSTTIYNTAIRALREHSIHSRPNPVFKKCTSHLSQSFTFISVVTNMIPYELFTLFNLTNKTHLLLSLWRIFGNKNTHKQRFLSVTTCRPPFFSNMECWFSPPPGFVYTAGESIFIFTLSLPTPPGKCPWSPHKDSLYCQSCGDVGVRVVVVLGVFIAKCL